MATDPDPTARPAAPAGLRSILVCPNCGARNSIRPNPRGSPHCGTCGKPLPWVVDATDATFEVEARTTATVLIDLWAPWCGPCLHLADPRGAGPRAPGHKVIKVNVDDNRALSQRFGAMSIPTMVVMKDGRELTVRLSHAEARPRGACHAVPRQAESDRERVARPASDQSKRSKIWKARSHCSVCGLRRHWGRMIRKVCPRARLRPPATSGSISSISSATARSS